MKKLSVILTCFAFCAIFSLAMCSSNSESSEQSGDTTISQLEEKMDNIESGDSSKAGLGKEYTAKYICPMHCKGSGSEKAGKCSECEMDLIENQGAQKK